MQFIDLHKQYKRIEQEIHLRIRTVLEHGCFILGPEVRELEEKLAAFVGARHCISCCSGTDALLMPLMAWGIGPGDAVFVPPFTFFSTAEVVSLLGAMPVFVDVDPVSRNMAAKDLARAIEAVRQQDASIYPLPRAALEQQLAPKAVIPVDLFGMAADYNGILPLARKYGLYVLEDAAQSFGGEYFGKRLCNLGCHAAATSFFPAKTLGCYGDGGALFTDDDALADILLSIRAHGKGAHRYDNCRIGINGRLDTLQAAILLPKFAIFTEELQRRQQAAQWYALHLENAPGVTPPAVPEGCVSAWGQYCILVANNRRDAVAAALAAQNIPSNVYYPKGLHLQGAYAHYGHKEGDMPVCERLCGEILALPFHPYLEEEDVARVCAVIRGAPA